MKRTPKLEVALDCGRSSIGWSVFQSAEAFSLLGCGSVVFRSDDSLAVSRRAYRRQRRHIRSTRQRIERMKRLIESLGTMTREALDKPGCAWPWKLAARVLRTKSGENVDLLLNWAELWDVLRWYAHNRGYDGNRRWSGEEEKKEDSQKVENANALMRDSGTTSMAETVCVISGIDPLGGKNSCNIDPMKRFKAKNAAFPREVVEAELRRILRLHFGKLKGVDEKFERVLCDDWRQIECDSIRLPRRYEGGLLFGQLVPRFDNRIISLCPITGEKVPSRHSREFLNYRWGMQMANVLVAEEGEKMRMLKREEIRRLDTEIRKEGSFTENEFKKAVREITGCKRDNLDTMLMHPEAKKALVVDPVQELVTKGEWKVLFPLLSERMQKRARGRLWNGKMVSLAELRAADEELGNDSRAFDAELATLVEAKNTRRNRAEKALTREDVLAKKVVLKPLDGRAAYSREVLRIAFDEVMQGKHPKAKEGCLCLTEAMRVSEGRRRIEEQTNNHRVRHRLLILQRLVNAIVDEYADRNPEGIKRITIEVNRDLREMSGMTEKEVAQDLGQRLANHSSVVSKLEKALGEDGRKITAGLIRKARIADDLGWRCPYTGKQFEPIDLVTKLVDKDHIISRSQRPTDSLDSLVVTYKEINAWKGNRTAWQFIKEEGGKTVPGQPQLSIMPLARYREFVEGLEGSGRHEDDKKRKQKRKALMLLAAYEEKKFTSKDLTETSQLVRLAAHAVTQIFDGCKERPRVISLPGSVTGAVRKAWDVVGCLAAANPGVLDQGELRSKTEIRDITHLHHALDACVIGLATRLIPNNGRVWELLSKRRLSADEQRELHALEIIELQKDGAYSVKDLPEEYKKEIRERLKELRVVQHVPARMDGLRAEQNIWRVLEQKQNGDVTICQYRRGPDGKRAEKIVTEKASKLLGLNPAGGQGKLKRLKGALVIPDNYGVALDPKPTIIPFHKVPTRLRELRILNGGKEVRVLRNGQLIQVPQGTFKGIWRVFSAKNNSIGICLDIGRTDVVRLKNKTEGHKINVRLASLLKDGMTALKTPLTGVPSCPTISSA
jgi:hypothetical protein